MLEIIVAGVLILFAWLAAKRQHRIRVWAAQRTWRRSARQPPPQHLPSRDHVRAARRGAHDVDRPPATAQLQRRRS